MLGVRKRVPATVSCKVKGLKVAEQVTGGLRPLRHVATLRIRPTRHAYKVRARGLALRRNAVRPLWFRGCSGIRALRYGPSFC